MGVGGGETEGFVAVAVMIMAVKKKEEEWECVGRRGRRGGDEKEEKKGQWNRNDGGGVGGLQSYSICMQVV